MWQLTVRTNRRKVVGGTLQEKAGKERQIHMKKEYTLRVTLEFYGMTEAQADDHMEGIVKYKIAPEVQHVEIITPPPEKPHENTSTMA